MAGKNSEDLNNIEIEAPGGSQATHSAAGSSDGPARAKPRGPRSRFAEGVDRLGETPALRRVSRAANVSTTYVREHSVADMKVDLEGEIREHPIRSIAIALGAGYLLAKLLD